MLNALVDAFYCFRIVDSGQHVLKRTDIQLKAPICNPNKIICIGMNYVDHCLEQNCPIPTEPILFSKFSNAITDPGEPILYPEETEVCSFLNIILFTLKGHILCHVRVSTNHSLKSR